MRGLARHPGRRRVLHGAGALLLAAAGGAATAARAATPQRSRIVSVGGALTETLYALGAQSEIVGVDTTSLAPDAARLLPSVGYARALSAEGVLSLAPTLVVATEDAGPPAVLRQIEAARVPVAVLDSDHRFEGVLARTTKLGELVGRGAQAQALVQQLQADWQAALARVAGRRPNPPLKLMFVLSHAMNQVRMAGRDTAADAMIGYAGAANAFGGVSGYKPLTPEAAIAAAPDVLLATDQGLEAAGGVDGLLRLPGLAQTPAGRGRRVIALEAMWLLGFGPRLPQALAALADRLYPPKATA
jgi:iron complex transport system substrate-binding protein